MSRMKNVLVSLSLVVVSALTLVGDTDYILPYQKQEFIKIERGFGYDNKFLSCPRDKQKI